MSSCWTARIDLPLAEDKEKKWKPYPLHKGKTRILDKLKCHVSVLSPDYSPHLPHSHADEEILIILDGEAELIISGSDSLENARIEKVTAGTFVYYPAWKYHTIRNSANSPVTYLMFKWVNSENNKDQISPIQLFNTSNHFPEMEKLFSTNKLFENKTTYLDKLHCHLTTLKPGGGYKAHKDNYDVAIVTFSGEVKTLGESIKPYSVIYYPAGKKHEMKNDLDMPAKYIVFEFHSSRYKTTKQRIMNMYKKILH